MIPKLGASTVKGPDGEAHGVPLALRVAAGVVVAEAAALAASVVALVVNELAGQGTLDAFTAGLIAVLAAAAAAGLGLVGRGLLRGRRYGRSPAVLAQILALPVAIDAIRQGAFGIGVPLLIAAAVGLGGLFAPSTTRRLFG